MNNPYHDFLSACLRSDGDRARALTRAPNWNWERLFADAADEALLPTLAWLVQDGLDIAAPGEVLDSLAAIFELNRERNQYVWRELIAAVRLLNDIGIEPTLLKGSAYLASKVYPDPGVRHLADLDLLIPANQLDSAVQLFLNRGYVTPEEEPFVGFRHHHAPLTRGSVWIELHHAIGMGHACSILPAEDVIQQAVSVSDAEARYRIPCPTHLMAHVITHSQIASYDERIWPQLRGMYDVVRLQNRYAGEVDWSEVSGRFGKAQELGTLNLYLLDVRRTLGFQVLADTKLSVPTRLRRLRRSAIRRFPALRYFDPIYMASVLLKRRLNVLRILILRPGGFAHLRSHLFDPTLWRNILADIVEGRSR